MEILDVHAPGGRCVGVLDTMPSDSRRHRSSRWNALWFLGACCFDPDRKAIIFFPVIQVSGRWGQHDLVLVHEESLPKGEGTVL